MASALAGLIGSAAARAACRKLDSAARRSRARGIGDSAHIQGVSVEVYAVYVAGERAYIAVRGQRPLRAAAELYI